MSTLFIIGFCSLFLKYWSVIWDSEKRKTNVNDFKKATSFKSKTNKKLAIDFIYFTGDYGCNIVTFVGPYLVELERRKAMVVNGICYIGRAALKRL